MFAQFLLELFPQGPIGGTALVPLDMQSRVLHSHQREIILGFLKKGWVLIGVDGYPLGWAKYTGSNFKNKYYPGWRWQ